MTHHTRFARSFARTVPTPEANKSLSIGMFRFGAVRFARAVGVCRRATFSSKFPQFSLKICTSCRVREKCARANCARRRPGWTPFVGR